MRYYDLSSALEYDSYIARHEALLKSATHRRVVVGLGEITERSLNQNSYLHLILSYFAVQIGLTLDYVKRQYFKATVNPDLFVCEKYDTLLERYVKYLRSSASLNREEMSLAIDRFIRWSATEAGIVLPSVEDKKAQYECEIIIKKYEKYL